MEIDKLKKIIIDEKEAYIKNVQDKTTDRRTFSTGYDAGILVGFSWVLGVIEDHIITKSLVKEKGEKV